MRTNDVQLRPDRTLKVIIRRSKSDQFGEVRTAFTPVATAQLVLEWLHARKLECAPVFCPVYRGKAIDRSLSDMTVRRLVKETAQEIGFSEDVVFQFSGHSCRVGAAQDLLREGCDGIAIMRAGGWKSTQTVPRYLQEAEHNVWENSQARSITASRR